MTGRGAAFDATEQYRYSLWRQWDGTPIMVSMGSLGHYMHDLSDAGFGIRDFLHEGNGDAWKAAAIDPRPYARYMLVEEYAEGGDLLSHLLKEKPEIAAGYRRVAEGGNVVLYVRNESGTSR